MNTLCSLKKISVVIAVYNGEKFIQKTIDSLKKQTYKNFEVILIDGSSTDKTMEIVYSNKELFVEIISEKDKGMYDAINKGFSHASGSIFCYINSDDLLKEYTLYEVAHTFSRTNADLVFGDVEYIDEKGKFIYSMKGTKLSKRGVSYIKRVPFAQQSSFWTKELFIEIGGFDASLKYVADSKFLLIAYLLPKVKTKYLPMTLSCFRFHNDSFSVGSSQLMHAESAKMRGSLIAILKSNKLLKIYFEFFTKIKNIKGICARIAYKGPKLK
jgi:glycosyltransferase involved in cell wall biosynthesis